MNCDEDGIKTRCEFVKPPKPGLVRSELKWSIKFDEALN